MQSFAFRVGSSHSRVQKGCHPRDVRRRRPKLLEIADTLTPTLISEHELLENWKNLDKHIERLRFGIRALRWQTATDIMNVASCKQHAAATNLLLLFLPLNVSSHPLHFSNFAISHSDEPSSLGIIFLLNLFSCYAIKKLTEFYILFSLFQISRYEAIAPKSCAWYKIFWHANTWNTVLKVSKQNEK